MIDKSSGIPVYKQIEASLRSGIDRGVYPVGSKLPSEDLIAEEYGVSRGTVRQALSELSNHGIIKRIHGSGTFVCEPGNEFEIDTDHFISFLDELERIGISVDTTVLDKQFQSTDGPLKEVFQGTTLYSIKRLRKRGDKPVMFSVDYVPIDLFPGLPEKYDDRASIYEFLENEYSIQIKKVKRTFYAISSTGEVAKALSLKKGEPLFYIIQQAYDEFGRCVDCAHLYVVSEEMHFSVMTTR
jgi:DNA-binding GntR family transcriptional regulator